MFEFEIATSTNALWTAWQKVSANNSHSCGADQISLDYYRFNAKENIKILNYSLVSNSYEPWRERSFLSHKNRMIYISSVEDKIVHTAIANVIYESIVIQKSVHGFVKNRSIFTAHKELKKSI